MYAIIVKEQGVAPDYYPDPLYDNKVKAQKKVEYLRNYRIKHEMTPCEYTIKKLSATEQAEHQRQWAKWCSMID